MIELVRSSHLSAWATTAPERGASERAPRQAVFAAAVDDTRTVLAIVALLVVVGVGLVMVAVWLARVTRPDPELLAPLEVMGDRKWRRGEPVWQRRRLDEVRPVGAEPSKPATAPPALDASYDVGPTAPGFEDLNEADAAMVPAAAAPEPDDTGTDEAGTDDTVLDAPVPDEIVPDETDAADTATSDPTTDDTGADDAAAPEFGPDEAVPGETAADYEVPATPSPAAVMSDDVSATPPEGLTRLDIADVGPSAHPDATLAELVAVSDHERPEPAVDVEIEVDDASHPDDDDRMGR